MPDSFGAVTVEGLTELTRACDELADRIPFALRDELGSRVGEPVARETRSMFVSADLGSPASSRLKTADGVKTQVTKAGEVLVIQTLRKSRKPGRRRHNYGRLQLQHGFWPALDAREPETVREIGLIVDEANRQHW